MASCPRRFRHLGSVKTPKRASLLTLSFECGEQTASMNVILLLVGTNIHGDRLKTSELS